MGNKLGLINNSSRYQYSLCVCVFLWTRVCRSLAEVTHFRWKSLFCFAGNKWRFLWVCNSSWHALWLVWDCTTLASLIFWWYFQPVWIIWKCCQWIIIFYIRTKYSSVRAHARTLKHLHMPLVVSHVTSQLCNKLNIRINKKKWMYFMDSWVSFMVGYA